MRSLPIRPIATIACAAVLAARFGTAQAQEINTDWIDWKRVDAGEILYQTTNLERGTARIDLAVEIDADWQSIWDIITACDRSPEYVPHVVTCTTVASVPEEHYALFEQTVKPAFFMPKFEHVFRLDYDPPHGITVHHVSGPIDRLEGAWRLLERPNGKIALLHTMTVNPAFPVPRFFVRNTLERDLPKVLREIRRRAEQESTEHESAAHESAAH